jgi:glutamyl-tRNA reductase
MIILCVGLNHQTAPLGWRERLAFDRPAASRALALLKARHDDAEFVLLSTCNRVEIYAAAPAAGPLGTDALVGELAELRGVRPEELSALVYRHSGEAAVRHLFEVAASLDSLLVGEAQILGQVKEAFVQALEAEATGKFLNRLFHRAFGAAKRVQSATAIGRRRTSLAAVAVDYARRIFSDLAAKRVLVIGSGEVAELALVHLRSVGARTVTVVGRSAEKTAALAGDVAAHQRPWEELDECLADSDIVICSTAAAEPILRGERAAEVQKRRHWSNWLILDLGVPRNVEAEAGRLANVYLYDLDALGRVVSENVEFRQQEIDRASEIIADEVRAFLDWFEARDVGPLVDQLEARLHELGDEEVARLFTRLPPDLDEATRQEIALATHRIVHKLLHEPIERLKQDARDGHAAMNIRALRRLFGLGREGDDG